MLGQILNTQNGVALAGATRGEYSRLYKHERRQPLCAANGYQKSDFREQMSEAG